MQPARNEHTNTVVLNITLVIARPVLDHAFSKKMEVWVGVGVSMGVKVGLRVGGSGDRGEDRDQFSGRTII